MKGLCTVIGKTSHFTWRRVTGKRRGEEGERKGRRQAASDGEGGAGSSRQSYEMLNVMGMPAKEFSVAVLLSLPHIYKIQFVLVGSLVKYPSKFACKPSEPVLSLSRTTP